ncbi:MAG: hypothetical protein RL717_1528 [Pseudomonadota bacterium]|jgi:membrane AbrB-like protein
MWNTSSYALRAFLLTLMLALLAASVCVYLDTPLPWMIGPLFATAGARLLQAPLYCPVPVREAGQWAIGTALGLYFTPAVIHILLTRLGLIAAGVAFALLLGVLCASLLRKLSGADRPTAFFAMAVGGASEMATQGERYGAAVEFVAAAHSLRIMMVVATIPFALKFFDVHGSDAYAPGTHEVAYIGLTALVLVTTVTAVALKRLGWPNAWVIGPLLMSIALTANGVTLSALPEWSIHLGQLFIGISLGTRFTPTFLRAAPRFMISVMLCTVLALFLAAGFGWLLALVGGIHPATAILATSPGGIAEMSLTAKTLQLGVPIVTTFHVTRMAVLVLTIGPLFRLLNQPD